MEARLNLVWLKYVSYACVAGAVFFYFAIRLNRLAVSRNVTLAPVCGVYGSGVRDVACAGKQ